MQAGWPIQAIRWLEWGERMPRHGANRVGAYFPNRESSRIPIRFLLQIPHPEIN
jgi:hypothetical protein